MLALPIGIAAQPIPGSGNSSGNQPAAPEQSGIDGFMDFIEVSAEWLVQAIRPEGWTSQSAEPDWTSLESPRHTVLSFKSAMKEVAIGHDDAWTRALRALGGAGGQEQAHHLEGVFARLGEIAPIDLPGPDQVRERNMSRFEVFPYGLDRRWIWNALDGAPEGSIVVIEQEDGRWVFAPETVRDAERLYESMSSLPPSYDSNQVGQSVVHVFSPTVDQTDWRGWLLLTLTIAGGAFLGLVLKKTLQSAAGKAERGGSDMAAEALRSLATPIALLCLALSIGVGLGFIHLAAGLNDLRWAVVQILLLVAIGWFLIDLLDLFVLKLRHWTGGSGSGYADMAVGAFRRAIRVVALVVLVLFVCQNMLNLNVGAFLGGVGLIGLALSLAAKDSVKNLFGAVMVFMNRPFVVGDWIRFQNVLGEVEDVSMQVTRIRLLSGELWTVPNMHFIEDPVENLFERKFLRRQMDIAVTYDTSPEKVDEALRICDETLREEEVVKEGRFQLDRRAPEISFSHFGEHFLNLRVYYWYFFGDGDEPQRQTDSGWFDYLRHCSLVNTLILERFNEAGIDFAFPTRTMYLTDDPDRTLSVSLNGDSRASENEDEEQGDTKARSSSGRYNGGGRSREKARTAGGDHSSDDDDGGGEA